MPITDARSGITGGTRTYVVELYKLSHSNNVIIQNPMYANVDVEIGCDGQKSSRIDSRIVV